MPGVVAPKDPTMKRKGFYIMRNKAVAGSPQPDGRGIQFLYMNDGRMLNAARLVGGITDENILNLMKTAEGFRKLVHSVGVTVEMDEHQEMVDFYLQMYGKTDAYRSGTNIKIPVKADGMEMVLDLTTCDWSEDDDVPGQIRFEFPKAGMLATVAVKFYLYDGFDVPEVEDENPVDFASEEYQKLLDKGIMQVGNNARLKKAIEKAKAGEDVTIAFIGGSITQGAGAIPINTECYAYKTYQGLCKLAGKGEDENIHYIKAGVGGTPSELGMLRYEKDVLRDGTVTPDIVVVEFAVNDAGDETGGECYDSLVRKILAAENKPAVILEFAVFADDWNLQKRFIPVGEAYQIPMVSTRDIVVEQFYKKPGAGRVVSKNQFFYDSFHPTNAGHTFMAGGLIRLMELVDAAPMDEDTLDLEAVPAPLGGEFQNVQRLDRVVNKDGVVIIPGSFSEMDKDLQCVEQDMNLFGTPEFPDNWHYAGGQGEAFKPLTMDITCSALLMINKDTASPQGGKAEVWVDGEKVLTVDPRKNGWTHCNPLICFRGRECKQYHVEVRMAPGDEDKWFTILGFGYVK